MGVSGDELTLALFIGAFAGCAVAIVGVIAVRYFRSR